MLLYSDFNRHVRYENALKEWAKNDYQCELIIAIKMKYNLYNEDIIKLKQSHGCN